MATQARLLKIREAEVTVEHDDGTPPTSHAIWLGASITLNGRPCRMGDLLVGDFVAMQGNPVQMLSAFRPDHPSAADAAGTPAPTVIGEVSDKVLMAEVRKRGLDAAMAPGNKPEQVTDPTAEGTQTDANPPEDGDTHKDNKDAAGARGGRKTFEPGHRVRWQEEDTVLHGAVESDHNAANKTVLVKPDGAEHARRIARDELAEEQ